MLVRCLMTQPPLDTLCLSHVRQIGLSDFETLIAYYATSLTGETVCMLFIRYILTSLESRSAAPVVNRCTGNCWGLRGLLVDWRAAMQVLIAKQHQYQHPAFRKSFTSQPPQGLVFWNLCQHWWTQNSVSFMWSWGMRRWCKSEGRQRNLLEKSAGCSSNAWITNSSTPLIMLW